MSKITAFGWYVFCAIFILAGLFFIADNYSAPLFPGFWVNTPTVEERGLFLFTGAVIIITALFVVMDVRKHRLKAARKN